jgi:hypothetical protein
MTTQHDALIEKITRAVMISDGCGYMLDGERVFCDDTRLEEYERQRVCACKVSAKAALAAVLAHYSDPANVSDGMVEAAILAWSDDYGRDAVHNDWRRLIAAALRVMAGSDR